MIVRWATVSLLVLGSSVASGEPTWSPRTVASFAPGLSALKVDVVTSRATDDGRRVLTETAEVTAAPTPPVWRTIDRHLRERVRLRRIDPKGRYAIVDTRGESTGVGPEPLWLISSSPSRAKVVDITSDTFVVTKLTDHLWAAPQSALEGSNWSVRVTYEAGPEVPELKVIDELDASVLDLEAKAQTSLLQSVSVKQEFVGLSMAFHNIDRAGSALAPLRRQFTVVDLVTRSPILDDWGANRDVASTMAAVDAELACINEDARHEDVEKIATFLAKNVGRSKLLNDCADDLSLAWSNQGPLTSHFGVGSAAKKKERYRRLVELADYVRDASRELGEDYLDERLGIARVDDLVSFAKGDVEMWKARNMAKVKLFGTRHNCEPNGRIFFYWCLLYVHASEGAVALKLGKNERDMHFRQAKTALVAAKVFLAKYGLPCKTGKADPFDPEVRPCNSRDGDRIEAEARAWFDTTRTNQEILLELREVIREAQKIKVNKKQPVGPNVT